MHNITKVQISKKVKTGYIVVVEDSRKGGLSQAVSGGGRGQE